MKISFENLGAIKKIDLDLSKKLTLLCGPNGTGKTYVSYAVYGYLDRLISIKIFRFEELLGKKKLDVELDYEKLFRLKKSYISRLDRDIANVFGLSDAGNEQFFPKFKAKSLFSAEYFKEQLDKMSFDYNIVVGKTSLDYTKRANSNILHISAKEALDVKDTHIVNIFQNARIGKYLCNSSIVNAYILPVERNSAYTFADQLAINRLNSDNLQEADMDHSVYPKPIQDALAIAINLKNIKKRTSKYAPLADNIEQEILGGKISISDDGELLFAPQNSEKVNLPIHLSASIIKNLSGLLVYLRHQAKENDLLIIDEPELGLHPDNQVRLARIFARIINAGIRLMISTHSDYIIRELNNLVMLSSDNEAVKKVAKELGYKDDECIKKEDLGAYLFHFNTKDTSIVDVDMLEVTDSGVEIETIDEEICLLNQRTDDLFYALKYGEEIE